MIRILSDRLRTLDGVARGIAEAGREVLEAKDVDFASMAGVGARAIPGGPQALVMRVAEPDPTLDEDGAFQHYTESAVHLAAAALVAGATPVLISTANVFGAASGPFSDADEPSSGAIVASAQRQGEVFMLRAAAQGIVIRIGWLLEDGLARERARLLQGARAAERDVSIMGASSLGKLIVRLLAQSDRGIFHAALPATPTERVILEAMRSRIAPTAPAIGHPQTPRKRPLLLCDRLRRLGLIPTMSWQACIAEATERAEAVPELAGGAESPHAAWFRGQGLRIEYRRLAAGAKETGDLEVAAVFVEEGKIVVETTDADRVLRTGEGWEVSGATVQRICALDPSKIQVVLIESNG